MSRARVRWIFDALPPSGARRGGDPSEHAFKHDLGTFVREVMQNANDQRAGFPEVRFRAVELEGQALAAFEGAVSWGTLEPHLLAAAATKGGDALAEALQKQQETGRLLLLCVEDRNTVGLTGGESQGDSHFRALCKDTLYSHKSSESAGGSYGLGKSVLWAFSGLSTVLFNSVLLEEVDGFVSPRLIGRTELPSHEVAGGKWFTGSGWFGRPVRVGADASRAESIWDKRAATLSTALHIGREHGRHGTSILIVGFRDPTSEAVEATGELLGRMRDAVTRFFWPAMVMRGRRLKAFVGDAGGEEQVDVGADRVVRPFVECYRRLADARSGTQRPAGRDAVFPRALSQPGDVAVRTIAVELPDHRDGTPTASAEVDLVVRLAPEAARDPFLGHVAMFRGPGMVVRYWDRGALTIGMRPFHATLVCGEARDPENPTDGDREVEYFLRAAEPPGHDEWMSTPALKQAYKRGYAKALARLKDRVTEELRHLLAARPVQGTKGPDRLQKRFPIGGRGGGGSEPAVFHFAGLDARFDGVRWSFEGTIRPTRFGIPWRARLSLHELGEDGRPVDAVPVGSLQVTADGARRRVERGVGIVDASGAVRELTFRGTSRALAPGPGGAAALGFELVGELSPEGP